MTNMTINPKYFHLRYKLFQLDAQTIAQLEEQAKEGDANALYGLGRYYYVVRPEEDSMDKGFDYLKKAYILGQYDAAAALSIVYEEGACCPIDSIKAKQLLNEAIENGSLFGVLSYAYALICGTLVFEKDLDKAMQVIDKALESQAFESELLGYLLYLRAWAKSERGDADFSAEDYAKAIRSGCTCAWRWYADALCIDENKEIKNIEEYQQILSDGIEAGDCESMMMHTYLQSMSAPEGNNEGERFIREYEKAFKLGSGTAAFMIAQTYYNGWDGVEENIGKAWKWYLEAARYNHIDSLEAMHDMCYVTHDVDLPIDKVDTIALLGARSGSMKLLGRTVIAYSEGRLTEHAAEIEKYYVPVFDAEENDLDDDVSDDDGRFDAHA